MTEGLLTFLQPREDNHRKSQENEGDRSRGGRIRAKKVKEEAKFVNPRNLTFVDENYKQEKNKRKDGTPCLRKGEWR